MGEHRIDGEFKPTHRHYKGGLYQKLFDAIDSETDLPLTVYRTADGRAFVRPKAMFDEKVSIRGAEGTMEVPRFEPLP